MKEEKAQKETQKEFYFNLASKFDKEQKRENRNHINKIKAISNYLKIKNDEKVLEVGIGNYAFCIRKKVRENKVKLPALKGGAS